MREQPGDGAGHVLGPTIAAERRMGGEPGGDGVNSGHGVRIAACAGLGLILQPLMLLGPDIEAGRLVQLFPDWWLGERSVSLLYYRDRRMTPRLASFIAFATRELAEGRSGRATG